MPRKLDKDRVNTIPAIRALVNELDGSWAQKAKMIGVGTGRVWQLCRQNGYTPPTLDSLARYTSNAAKHGVRMTFFVSPEGRLSYQISHSRSQDE